MNVPRKPEINCYLTCAVVFFFFYSFSSSFSSSSAGALQHILAPVDQSPVKANYLRSVNILAMYPTLRACFVIGVLTWCQPRAVTLQIRGFTNKTAGRIQTRSSLFVNPKIELVVLDLPHISTINEPAITVFFFVVVVIFSFCLFVYSESWQASKKNLKKMSFFLTGKSRC